MDTTKFEPGTPVVGRHYASGEEGRGILAYYNPNSATCRIVGVGNGDFDATVGDLWILTEIPDDMVQDFANASQHRLEGALRFQPGTVVKFRKLQTQGIAVILFDDLERPSFRVLQQVFEADGGTVPLEKTSAWRAPKSELSAESLAWVMSICAEWYLTPHFAEDVELTNESRGERRGKPHTGLNDPFGSRAPGCDLR